MNQLDELSYSFCDLLVIALRQIYASRANDTLLTQLSPIDCLTQNGGGTFLSHNFSQIVFMLWIMLFAMWHNEIPLWLPFNICLNARNVEL